MADLLQFLIKKHQMLEGSCAKRTCVLVVQPWTLKEKNPSLCKKLLSFIRKLKEKGVLVGSVSYADAVFDSFVKSSDFAFFMVPSNLAQGFGISRSKAESMCKRSHFLPINYPKLVSLLDPELEKNNIDHLLIVGGFRDNCVLALAKSMCKNSRLKGLKIRLIEQLLVSRRENYKSVDIPKRFAKYRKYHSCDISISKKDPNLLYLRYFK